MKTQSKTDANQAYKTATAEVKTLMFRLQQHIAQHELKQEKNPGNWGFVGDMNHYAEILKNEILEVK